MDDYFRKITELFASLKDSDSPKDAFHRWLADEKFSGEKERALREVWDALPENGQTRLSPEMRRSLKDVRRKIARRRRSAGVLPLRFWQVSAACLLAALISTLSVVTGDAPEGRELLELYVPEAETASLTLPDGTRVKVNSGAMLLYPEEFSDESRCVYLMGEAGFSVAEDEERPFIVKAGDFQVTALGTEFNLQACPGEPTASATLLSGSIEVRLNSRSAARILHPSEQLVYDRRTGQQSVHRPDLEEVTAWQRGELLFRSVTLQALFTALEKRYDCPFVYAPATLGEDTYMFRFSSTASLSEVMDIVARVAGNIRYRTEGGKCHVYPLRQGKR
ncbi:MAG: FecR domain-containing protein [Proteiniphilum sp.]|jgi:ferric-dicitrate binding protein FerR (iron transport regulator)|nr:FecR domain-containing protein [Proteiniphilum sp.]